MANLIYSALTSLDGYVADEHGKVDWARPDEEVHGFANDLERLVGTHLYGRRMYEVMRVWESADFADQPRYLQDSTPRRWRRCPAPGRGSNATSIPMRSGG